MVLLRREREMKIIVRELQNRQSTREGQTIEAKTLSAAKTKATKDQMFQGTVLTLEDEHGNQLAYKDNAKWVDVGYPEYF